MKIGSLAAFLYRAGLYVLLIRLESVLNFNDYVGFDDFDAKFPRFGGVCG